MWICIYKEIKYIYISKYLSIYTTHVHCVQIQIFIMGHDEWRNDLVREHEVEWLEMRQEFV